MPALTPIAIDAIKSTVPARRANVGRQNEYDTIVADLVEKASRNEGAKLELSEGETSRAVSLRLHQAAKRANVNLSTRNSGSAIFAFVEAGERPAPVVKAAKATKTKAEKAA